MAGGDEASGIIERLIQKTKELEVPVVGKPPGALQFCLGVLNCCLFGCGAIVAGIINKDTADVLVGVLQLVLPFVGWAWALLWGILMILEVFQKE